MDFYHTPLIVVPVFRNAIIVIVHGARYAVFCNPKIIRNLLSQHYLRIEKHARSATRADTMVVPRGSPSGLARSYKFSTRVDSGVTEWRSYGGRMSILGKEVTIELGAQTKSSALCDEADEPEIEIAMVSSVEDGRFVFPINLPEGLGLRGVGIVEGKPEFRFGASPHTPTITEEDIAAALRLAYEGERPEFFYIGIPPGHPFYGRQFKQYKPQWLRKTSFGETLSEADWKMKSLHIGARSNDAKTEFCAWKKDSKLTGLAMQFDFRSTKSGGSIIMSCTSVKVQKANNELVFQGEPRMRINDESNMRYSKYISKNFNAVAYYDEPLFLKMRELVKLILAAEWLVEKGVKVDEEWMMKCTQPKVNLKEGVKAIEENGCAIDSTSVLPGKIEPPSEMIPQPVNFKPPNSNVAVNTKEAEMYRSLTEQGVRRRYGWYDRGLNEGVMFDQDGTLYQQQRSLKVVTEHTSSTNGEVTESELMRLHIALPFNIPLPTMSEFGQFVTEFLPARSDQQEIMNGLGHISANLDLEHRISDRCVETKVSRRFQPSRPSTSLYIEETTTTKISVDDFDTLYGDMDPNQPIWPEIPGKREAVIPNVQSWSELYNETVPWPHTWQTPYIGVGEPVSGGGVSTRHIPVREEAMKPRAAVSETTWKDNYKRRGQELVARAVDIASKGIYL